MKLGPGVVSMFRSVFTARLHEGGEKKRKITLQWKTDVSLERDFYVILFINLHIYNIDRIYDLIILNLIKSFKYIKFCKILSV